MNVENCEACAFTQQQLGAVCALVSDMGMGRKWGRV